MTKNHGPAARQASGLHSAAKTLHQMSQTKLASIPKGTHTDQATFDRINELLGHTTGAVILHAFSVEVMLKAMLLKAGVNPAKTHQLDDLYAQLPDKARISTAQRFATAWEHVYGAKPDAALEQVLAVNATAFEDWRYRYEENGQRLEGRIGEMQLAFDALNDEYWCNREHR